MYIVVYMKVVIPRPCPSLFLSLLKSECCRTRGRFLWKITSSMRPVQQLGKRRCLFLMQMLQGQMAKYNVCTGAT